jgi:hypothetical protein
LSISGASTGTTDAGIRIPAGKSGVYEARLKGQEERLTIGNASNLNSRVRRGFVQGKMRHSSGKDIRANEDVTNVEVRWAETDRQYAVEEELHRLDVAEHEKLPKHTDHT